MCFYVPTAGAIITSVIWKKNKSVKVWWLNLLFWGGALFGVVDHWWNGELFLVSGNLGSDLLLGVTITLGILAVWGIMIAVSKRNPTLAGYTKNTA